MLTLEIKCHQGRIPAHQALSLPEIHNMACLTLPLERDGETNHVFGFQVQRYSGYKALLSLFRYTVSRAPFQIFTTNFFSLFLYPCLLNFFFFLLTLPFFPSPTVLHLSQYSKGRLLFSTALALVKKSTESSGELVILVF